MSSRDYHLIQTGPEVQALLNKVEDLSSVPDNIVVSVEFTPGSSVASSNYILLQDKRGQVLLPVTDKALVQGLQAALDDKQDVIPDLQQIREGALNGTQVLELPNASGFVSSSQRETLLSNNCLLLYSGFYYRKSAEDDNNVYYNRISTTRSNTSITEYIFVLEKDNNAYTFSSEEDLRNRVFANPSVASGASTTYLDSLSVGGSIFILRNYVQEVVMNGTSVPVVDGVVNLGNVVTEHQSLANYYTKPQIDLLLEDVVYADDYAGGSDYDDVPTGGGGEGLSDDVKRAILNCFQHVIWDTGQGQNLYDALEELFFPPRALVSISTVFDPGVNVIYDDATLDSLREYLTVTALYDDEYTAEVFDYTLAGTLAAGTSVVTATYQTKSSSFNVAVTARPVVSYITAVYRQDGAPVYPTDSLSILIPSLTVTAHYTDTSEVALTSDEYTLSGTLTVGLSTITVTYGTFTVTFEVLVSQAVELDSITAVYTQSGVVYPTDSLDSLKTDLVVTAHYTDTSSRNIASADYTLAGSLVAGTSSIAVAYQGKTTTFNVTVTAVIAQTLQATFDQGGNVIYSDASLDSLKNYLTVTCSYNNGVTQEVADTDYTLSGTLVAGTTSTVTVSYSGLTTTFSVVVTQAEEWDYNWVAATSNHTAPTGMTQYSGYAPVWGTNDEYYEVKDPKLQGATQSGLVGDIVVEVEMKWVEQGSYSAGSTLVVSSAERTGCKIFLANNSGNVNLYSAPSSGGNYALKTIGTDWNNFHKYRFELVGDLCKTYIDGVLVDTGYTYYSSWNGYPVIWSENQGNGRSHWAIKSIKYKMISNS